MWELWDPEEVSQQPGVFLEVVVTGQKLIQKGGKALEAEGTACARTRVRLHGGLKADSRKVH